MEQRPLRQGDIKNASLLQRTTQTDLYINIPILFAGHRPFYQKTQNINVYLSANFLSSYSVNLRG